MGHDRAARLAATAAGLACGAGIELPDGLALWRMAGGRPGSAAAVTCADPARALVAAMEGALTEDERRRGAHYTPAPLAADIVRLAFAARIPSTVLDPACGAGAVLLAAADALVDRGIPRAEAVARLHGADVDPLALAVAEAALALWSGGTSPPPGNLVVADALLGTGGAWPSRRTFEVVVGNPPFQGQLAADTARDRATLAALRARFGAAVTPYVDTAALFLLAAADLAGDGGRVALVQPLSTAGARDSHRVRAALAERTRVQEIWLPDGRPFRARVHVCVPVLEVGSGEAADWAAHLARARGVPDIDLGEGPTVATLASAVGGFRRHYYGLVGHVRDGGDGAPLVTSGAIDIGRTSWGERPIRFAQRWWQRPTVDVAAVRRSGAGLGDWLDQILRPKVVLASQTRVLEAAVDVDGSWVPCTPVVAVVPSEPIDAPRVAAVLCSPPVSAWAATRAAGTGLSPGAIRTSTRLALAAPLPVDHRSWREAAAALSAGALDEFAAAATEMYALPADAASAVTRWWSDARQ